MHWKDKPYRLSSVLWVIFHRLQNESSLDTVIEEDMGKFFLFFFAVTQYILLKDSTQILAQEEVRGRGGGWGEGEQSRGVQTI